MNVAAGTCGQIASWTAPTVADNCPGSSIVQTAGLTSGSSFPVGTSTVTYTATDAGGRTAACSFDVIIVDNEAPVFAACPMDQTISVIAGTCAATATWTAPTASDNCTASGSLTISESHMPGASFPVGATLVTYSTTDAAGNPGSCTFTITVLDDEDPVFAGCPADITMNNDPGQCTAQVTWTPPTASDNCTMGLVPSSTHSPGAFFPVGVTTVTYSATDASGNTANCSFDVTISDNQPPVFAACPADFTIPNAAGTCAANATWTEPTVSDNCTATGMLVVSRSHAPNDSFPVGVTTVTYSTMDATGNMGSCSFDVTVEDTEDPVLAGMPANMTVSAGAGTCAATVTWPAPTASDNCTPSGSLVLTPSQAPNTSFPVGMTTVTYSTMDAAGNTGMASFTVTVEDNESPVFSGCPVDQMISVAAGTCAQVATWTPPTVADNCTPTLSMTVNESHASGASFPVGATLVSYTTMDADGNPATCSFTITVMDDELPVFAGCPANITMSSDAGQCSAVVSWTEPTATDNCTPTLTINRSHAPGSIFPVGTTTVSYTTTDAAGNTGTCDFDVTVEDNEAPAFAGCPSDITISAGAGTCAAVYTWTEPTVSDNCTATGMLVVSQTHMPGDSFPVGATIVTYSTMDAALNPGSCSFTVTVEDNEDPVFAGVPADMTVSAGAGLCTASPTWTAPTASDNCTASGSLTIMASHSPGFMFPVGATTVTYSTTDAAGNTGMASFLVTVEDNEAPVFAGCPADMNVSVTPGSCARSVTWTPPTVSDNCTPSGMMSVSQSHGPGTIFGVGATVVSYTTADAAGNPATCSFTVTVVDDEDPVFTGCPADITMSSDAGQCSAVVSWTEPTAADNCTPSLTINRSHAPGAIFPLGATVVSYSTTDVAGNTGNCSFTVTVEDNEAPVFAGCPADITMSAAAGTCAAPISWTEPTPSDNCTAVGMLMVTQSHMPGASFPVGATIVTYSTTDAAGNPGSCSFTVTITDDEMPVFGGTPADITMSAAAASCAANVSWTEPTAADNCTMAASLMITRSHAPGDSFPVGMTTVTYSTMDAAGNAGMTSFMVTITDDEDPVFAACPADQTVSVLPGTCAAPANWTAPTVSDNCTPVGMLTPTESHAPGSSFPLGDTLVSYTSVDAAGNSATCSFTITIIDDEDPVFAACPADITMSTSAGQCSSVVTWTEPTVSDNCTPTLTVSRSHAPGSIFALGATTVTYSTTDAAGNTGTCSFVVTVEDNELPVFAGCPADATVSAALGTCAATFSWTEPSVSDNCSSSFTITRSHAPGASFSVGATIVSYSTMDAAGNTGTCSFTVTVEDNEAPVFAACPGDQTISATTGTCAAAATWVEPTASDNCTMSLTINRSHAPGDSFPVGATLVTYSTMDAAGNSENCTFTVTVEDNEAPVFSGCPTNINQNTDAGVCTALVTWTPPTAADNCTPGLTITPSHNPGDSFALGTTTVTYSTVDAAGNMETCSFDVIIADAEAPVFAGCPATINQSTDAAACTAAVTWVEPTASDNCTGSLTLSRSHSPGAIFPLGTTMVTYSTMDATGNMETCSFDVVISDNEMPTLNMPTSLTIDCTASTTPANTGMATANDNCDSSPMIGFSDMVAGSCPEVITRTWTVTDASGNSDSQAQTITVQDVSAPTLTIPADLTIDCAASTDPSNTGQATAVDNCDLAPVVSHSDNQTGTNPVLILRTWMAMDACGNPASSQVQTITLSDTTLPTITAPADVSIDCAASTLPANTGCPSSTTTAISVRRRAPATWSPASAPRSSPEPGSRRTTTATSRPR